MNTNISHKNDKQYDDDVYTDSNGHRYTKDNLLDGIIRFTNFDSFSSDLFDFDGDSDLDPGVFVKNPNGWNIRTACEWLHKNAKSASQHICATYVRKAIEAGGISTDGRPSWAWKYINYLPKIGFKCIGKISRENMHVFKAQPGDIAVYQKGNNSNVPGHICMWTGAEWASDFKQKNMIAYQNTPYAYIFRFS